MIKPDHLIWTLTEYMERKQISDPEESPGKGERLPEEEIRKGADYTKTDALKLEDLISELGETFHEMLFRKIRECGLAEADIYKKANLDRKLFSKIRSNPAYHPRKGTVLALAVALELDLDETVDFLAKAEYALSPGSKGDLIVKYFIERKIYDIDVINYALFEFQQPVLGG